MGWSNIVEWSHHITAGALVGMQIVYTSLVWMQVSTDGDGSVFRLWQQVENIHRRVSIVIFLIALISGVLLLRYTLVSPDLYRSTPYGRLLEIKIALLLAFGFVGINFPRAHTNRDGTSSPTARRAAAIALIAILALCIAGYALRYV